MPNFEIEFLDLLANSRAHGEFVRKNKTEFEAEDTATLQSLSETWSFVSQDGEVVRLRNRYGATYDFDLRTHHFTRVITAEEREEIERCWPKVANDSD